MSDISFSSITGTVFYLVFAVALTLGLIVAAGVVTTLPQLHLVLPSESLAATGMAVDHGAGAWFATASDHAMRILLLAVSFAPFTIVGLSLFRKAPIDGVALTSQVICAIALVVMMWVVLVRDGKYPLDFIPTIDKVLAVALFALFCFFTIMRDEDFTVAKGILSVGGIALSLLACAIILYIALFIAVWVHVISYYLDVWTYIDLTLGSEWKPLHILLMIFSHIQNITLFIAAFVGGVIACYCVISFLVRVRMAARYLQSAVTLGCLAFLLYAVTDEKSMRSANIDTIDFSVMIVIFALLSIIPLFGLFENILDLDD